VTKASGQGESAPDRPVGGGGRFRTAPTKQYLAAGTPQDADHAFVDVWARTDPKYRRRAIFLLTINVILFFALGCFTYWLRTGDPFPLIRPVSSWTGDAAPPRYPYWDLWRNSIKLSGPGAVSLTDFLIFPISVEHVPAHIVIVGLLMASLITIPIMVTMLYRLPVALVFLLIVGFVAVFPWLTITLFLSCIIAAARPFRFSFRYATVLLALLPVVVYFIIVSAGGSPSSAVAMAGPVERMKLYAPWVLALMASCVGSGIVLAVAYLIDYRPGGIAPLLAVLFTIPLVVFVYEVGTDELEYRLLEYDYGSSSNRVFVDLDTKDLIQRAAEMEWISDARKDERQIKAIIQNKFLLLKLALPTELVRMQEEVVERCDEFVRRFPSSRYVPNCLYLKGRALDMRVDMELLRREALLQFYSDFPCEASRETWQELLREDPNSPFATVAGVNLAMLDAREGRMRLAQDLLIRVVDRFSRPTQLTSKPSPLSGIRQLMARKPPSSTLGVDAQAVAEKASQLLTLVRENHEGRYEDNVYPENNPLSLLLRCDPRDRAYPDNLHHIEQLFPASRLIDNVMVRLALAEPDVNARRSKLMDCARRYRDGDAAPHAIYELGLLELDHNRKAEGREAFELLLKQYPASPWAASAQRKLVALEVAPKVK
jgi:hypothetical protein